MDGHERRQAIAGQGLEGCAHANPPRREVLFASREHLDAVGVDPGAIRENLTVDEGLRAELDGRRGMLARVVETGEVAVGDEIELL
jgi:MOSC domain-containing protein YiiM